MLICYFSAFIGGTTGHKTVSHTDWEVEELCLLGSPTIQYTLVSVVKRTVEERKSASQPNQSCSTQHSQNICLCPDNYMTSGNVGTSKVSATLQWPKVLYSTHSESYIHFVTGIKASVNRPVSNVPVRAIHTLHTTLSTTIQSAPLTPCSVAPVPWEYTSQPFIVKKPSWREHSLVDWGRANLVQYVSHLVACSLSCAIFFSSSSLKISHSYFKILQVTLTFDMHCISACKTVKNSKNVKNCKKK